MTDTLPGFLAHLDDAPSSLNAKVTPKKHRLLHVQLLRISSLGTPCRADWVPHRLLEGKVSWDEVNQTSDQHARRRVSRAKNEIQDLLNLLSSFSPELPFAMPKLDVAIVGQVGRCAWKRTIGMPSQVDFAQDGKTAQKLVTKFLLKLNPRVICSHSIWSPYAPHSPGISTKSTTTTICTHHDAKFGTAPVTFFPGKINRHFFDPRINGLTSLPDADIGVHDIGEYARALDKVEKPHLVQQIAKTKIELLGYFTPPPAISPSPARLKEIFGDQVWTKTDVHQWEEVKDGEKESIRQAMHEDLADVTPWPRTWRGRIEIQPWEMIAPCEGCGWTTGDILKNRHVHK